MYKDKEELNEISKKNTPDLKELSNKFINDLLEIGVNLKILLNSRDFSREMKAINNN